MSIAITHMTMTRRASARTKEIATRLRGPLRAGWNRGRGLCWGSAAAAPETDGARRRRATAVFASDRVRIAASVTCLERGREGEVIRVRVRMGKFFARASPAQLGWKRLPQ